MRRNLLILILLLLLIVVFNFNSFTDQSKGEQEQKDQPTNNVNYNNKIITLDNLKNDDLNSISLNKIITQLAKEKKQKAKNSFVFKGRLYSEKPGREININKSIKENLNFREEEKVKIFYKDIPPLIDKKRLLNRKKFILETDSQINKDKARVISHYTTYLGNSTTNRKNNISLSLRRLEEAIIKSQEEFSFNDILGPITSKAGYKEAPIIVNKRYVPQVGGGICQVSSTLYNAVKELDIEITERHHHSLSVNYVPEGEDATVVPDKLDFKFINKENHPITILTDIIDNYVVIYILEILD
ncbi:VanW family protein [Halonatronum saccharophilum]|uniref:VanW family protein n=1 Tax=Halonatronum saccharophilum TaxID=150060 RepID=UPI0004B1B490|nr:VanW family protein [Halonatronum saccharophilum]